MNIIKITGFIFLFLTANACTSIPEKVPKLIEVSANTIDSQSALVVAEWESSIAAASSSKKMIELIYTYVSSLDQSELSEPEKSAVVNFLKGYPQVIKQLDNVLSQQEEPQKSLSRFEEITNAIRLANSYVAKSVNENSRLEAVIESLNNLKTPEKKELNNE